MLDRRMFTLTCSLVLATLLGACAQVPQEAVDLSTTVGRDLEEVHRSHKSLANHFFSRMEKDVDLFIDETYSSQLIAAAAKDFKLDQVVLKIVQKDPNKLLPVLERFITKAHRIIEDKRTALKAPILEQKKEVILQIDESHQNLQAANAIVTGHLASVRNVHDMQNELLAKVNLGGLRDRVATQTANISDQISELTRKGQKAQADLEKLKEQKNATKAQIDAAQKKIIDIYDKLISTVK